MKGDLTVPYSHGKEYQPAVPTEIESDGLHITLPPVSHSPFEDHSGSQTTSTPVGSLIGALNSTLPIYLPQPRAALRDPEQARLLTLYTEHLSGWVSSFCWNFPSTITFPKLLISSC